MSRFYDNLTGFSDLKYEGGKLYGRLNGGTYQEIPTRGGDGTDGTNAYLYVAYAADNAGTGFSLTPSERLKFRAEIHTSTAIASPSLSDFAGTSWVKYIGDNGANGTNGTPGANGTNGTNGINAYLYVAYASDNAGTGFSLTPSAGLKFRAEIHTSTAIASPSLSDFAGTSWVKYISDDGADGTPTGTVIIWPVSTAPSGYLICDGSALSRAAYSALFAVLGTTYGEGDGATTFLLPDFRGYFLRGAGGENSPDIGTAQGDAIRNITGKFSAAVVPYFKASGAFYASPSNSGNGANGSYGFAFDASKVVPTAAENRPVNYAVNYCIKY